MTRRFSSKIITITIKRSGDNKELMIIPGAVHTDLYDRSDTIPFGKIESFFRKYLRQTRKNMYRRGGPDRSPFHDPSAPPAARFSGKTGTGSLEIINFLRLCKGIDGCMGVFKIHNAVIAIACFI